MTGVQTCALPILGLPEMSCFSPKLLKAMAEAKEISGNPNVKSYTTMEELKKALEE